MFGDEDQGGTSALACEPRHERRSPGAELGYAQPRSRQGAGRVAPTPCRTLLPVPRQANSTTYDVVIGPDREPGALQNQVHHFHLCLRQMPVGLRRRLHDRETDAGRGQTLIQQSQRAGVLGQNGRQVAHVGDDPHQLGELTGGGIERAAAPGAERRCGPASPPPGRDTRRWCPARIAVPSRSTRSRATTVRSRPSAAPSRPMLASSHDTKSTTSLGQRRRGWMALFRQPEGGICMPPACPRRTIINRFMTLTCDNGGRSELTAARDRRRVAP